MNSRVRKSVVCLVLLVLVGNLIRGLWLYWDKWRNSKSTATTATDSDLGYVGMDQCWVCHSSITASYLKTAMGRSFGPVNPDTDGEPFSENNSYHWELRDRMYEMTSEGGELFMTSYALDGSGNRVRQRREKITHWLGSGEKMRGCLSLQGNRHRLLHLAWYAPRNEWAPFAMRELGAPADDWVGYNCLYCHASYPRNAISARWVAEVDHFPEPLDLGPIDCERCHGPGQQHAQLARDTSDTAAIRAAIVNPARLPPERQLDVCAQCHLEPTTRFPVHRLVMVGRTPFSFRPGDRLQDHFFVFDYEDPAMHSDEDTEIVNQNYLLVRSACYTRSNGRMTCTTCHDPHRTPPQEEKVAYFRAKCLGCHSATDCTTPEIDPQALPASDCVKCHMTPTYAIDAVRAQVHRHKIERRPISNLNVPIEERLAHTLEVYGNESRGARLKLSFRHENLGQGGHRDVALTLAHLHNDLPDRWIAGQEEFMPRYGFGDPESLRRLGRFYLGERNLTQARSLARRALDLVPEFSEAALDLGHAELLAGNPTQAIELFRKVLSENPLSLEARRGLAQAYVKLNDEPHAYQAFVEWQATLDAYLDVDSSKQLGYYLTQAGRKKEAIGFLREALRINPDDREAQAGLDRLLSEVPELR